MICLEPAGSSARSDICLLLPDGRGVRNFVLGPFLKQACIERGVDVLHPLDDPWLSAYADGCRDNVRWHRLIGYRNRLLPYLLRNSLSYAQMYWVDNFPMRRNRNKPLTGSWQMRAATQAARRIGRLSASPRGMRLLSRAH